MFVVSAVYLALTRHPGEPPQSILYLNPFLKSPTFGCSDSNRYVQHEVTGFLGAAPLSQCVSDALRRVSVPFGARPQLM